MFRKRKKVVNVQPAKNRKELEAMYGRVWSVQEVAREFVITSIIGHTVVVRAKLTMWWGRWSTKRDRLACTSDSSSRSAVNRKVQTAVGNNQPQFFRGAAMQAKFNEITFTDADVVNPDDFIPAGAYNPHGVRPWLLHDHGFTVAIIFASCLQDALDIAVDEGKLDAFQVSEDELADYGANEDGVSRLGNAGEPFDIEALDAVELPNPPYSFVALFNAMQGKKTT